MSLVFHLLKEFVKKKESSLTVAEQIRRRKVPQTIWRAHRVKKSLDAAKAKVMDPDGVDSALDPDFTLQKEPGSGSNCQAKYC